MRLAAYAALLLLVSAAAGAQAIGGRVLDGERGTPLAHVRAWVRLPSSDSTVDAETASDGTFILALPRPGGYRLHFVVDSLDVAGDSVQVSADDFIQKEFRLALGPIMADSLGEIAGIVVDAGGGPLGDVEVAIDGSARVTRTDSTGRFEFARVPTGPQLMRVRRVGLRAQTIPLTVVAGRSPELEIALNPAAQTLEKVSVRAPRVYAMLGGQSFEERRKLGFGTFITPEQIDQKPFNTPVELLRGARGFRVELDPRAHQLRVVSSRGAAGADGGGMACVPALFVDGLATGMDLLALMPTSNILAIEAYPGPSTTPMEFGGTRAACGAVAVWTRTGAPTR